MKENKTSLIIQSETELEIEVIGGYVYLDSTDPELTRKVDDLYKSYDEHHKVYEQKDLTLSKSKLNEDEKNEQRIDNMVEYMNGTHNSINKLFGSGASKKIFRTKSIAGMEFFLENLPKLLDELQVVTGEYLDKRLNKDREQYAPLEDVKDNEIEDL